MDELFPVTPVPTFAVGQRVRIASYLGGPAMRQLYIGREGTVVASGIMPGVFYGQVGYFVEVRGLQTQQFPGHMLEHVIPEGSAAGNWDDCPWKPPV